MLDGGCPYYRCYATKDNKFMAIGALEPQFYKVFTSKFGRELVDRDRSNWPELEKQITERFLELTQSEWCAIYDSSDACITPVLDEIPAFRTPVNINSEPEILENEEIGLQPGTHQDLLLKGKL